MTPIRDGVLLRAAFAAAAAAWIIAITILVGGPISFRFAGLLIRAHSAVLALTVALGLTAFILFSGLRPASAEATAGKQAEAIRWWWTFGARRASWIAAALAVITVAIGVNWGTFAAGGSDSYCYLNQAELFTRGQVHDVEPMAADATWPGPSLTFVPAGHSLVPSKPGALSPICPAGYPAVLAVARLIGGRTAMFWVTPLMGGLAVWWTFVLARRLGGTSAGLFAGVLLATSPIFIYQLVQPMNDVAATALWCGVLTAIVAGPKRPGLQILIAGLLTGAALTVRPNLLPVGVVVGLWMLTRGFRMGLTFGLACVPGLLFVLFAQNAMYGSPLRSGYGDLSALFSMSHVWPNLTRYPRWVVSVHTPLILLALLAPFYRKHTTHTWLLVFAASVFACYLPYVVFEEWWYQRFVLPALPPLFVLTSVVFAALLRRVAMPLRAVAFVAVCATVGVFYLHTAVRRDAFRLQNFEQRFRTSGEYVATRLPANAAVITSHQSGSVRFYSGRSTTGWADIETRRLSEALDFLRRHGRKPYLLFEAWEEPEFRKRFAATDPLGALEWPPRVDIDRQVRIYDPDDYDRYHRGEQIIPERIVTRRR